MSERIMQWEDLLEEYRGVLTDEYGFFIVGYYSISAGDILQNCRPDDFADHAKAWAKSNNIVIGE